MAQTNEPLALKYEAETLDEIPGPYRLVYQQDAATKRYHLRVEGHPDTAKAAKLPEFRENNKALHARVEELETKLKAYEGIDGSDVAAMRERLAAFGDLDPEQARQALAAVGETKGRATELETALQAERQAHHAERVRNAVTFEFLKQGGHPAAADFVVGKAPFQVGSDACAAFRTTDLAKWEARDSAIAGKLVAPRVPKDVMGLLQDQELRRPFASLGLLERTAVYASLPADARFDPLGGALENGGMTLEVRPGELPTVVPFVDPAIVQQRVQQRAEATNPQAAAELRDVQLVIRVLRSFVATCERAINTASPEPQPAATV
jgi:hypothetical protein